MTTATLAPGTADAVLARMFPTNDPYLDDPVGWTGDRVGGFLWSKQCEIAESVRDNRFTAVHSCHDSGKSYGAADLVAWWLDVHPVGSAFAVTTAPTTRQVEAILWREIGRIHRKAELPGRITLDAQWYMGPGEKELVAYGRKPSDYDPDAFQGIHARYVLVIIDEAGGVPKALYDAVDTLVTNEDARVLAIGNPDDPSSHFAKVCGPGQGWNVIHIPYDSTPNFTDEEVPGWLEPLLLGPTWVEERKQRWGETSPLYISKVLGLFPEIGDDTLILPSWVREAQQRDLPGFAAGTYGCDVARMGKDETVMYRQRDGVTRLIESRHKQDTMKTAGMYAVHIKGKRSEVPAIIDGDGVGAGVFDRLRELELPVHEFRGGMQAHEPERFVNRRSEAYWHLREDFENGLIDLDPADEDLAAQLGSMKFTYDSRGKVAVETKDQMRSRGLPSPDRADAVMMARTITGGVRWPGPGAGAQGLDTTAVAAGILEEPA